MAVRKAVKFLQIFYHVKKKKKVLKKTSISFRPKLEIETAAHLEGNLAAGVNMVVLDTLELIVQVTEYFTLKNKLTQISYYFINIKIFIKIFKRFKS